MFLVQLLLLVDEPIFVRIYHLINKEPDSKTLSNVGGTLFFQNYNVFEIQFQKLILRCKSMRLAHILSYIASV